MRGSSRFALPVCLVLLFNCGSLTQELSRIETSAALSNDPTKTTGNPGGSGGTAVAAPIPAAAIWARTVAAAPTDSSFNGVAIDTSGNIYAAGSQFGTGTYTFGAQSTNGSNAGNNSALVKYDAGGTVQWARTVTASAGNSVFRAVTTDTSGNIYAAGCQNNSATFTYSAGVTATGNCAGNNLSVVKYNNTGTGVWARTVSGCGSAAQANAVATDSSGNVYVAGYQVGTAVYGYAGQNATGTSTFNNVVLVKYNSSGTTQWARSLAGGTNNAQFNALAVDTSGNIYAAGYQSGPGTYTYGSLPVTGTAGGANAVLVKYDSTGTVIWATTVSSGAAASQFLGLTTDLSGNIFAVGFQTGTGTFTYGGQSITGGSSGTNITLVKYTAAGTVLGAATLTAGTGNSQFNSVTTDAGGNIFAAGFQTGTGTYTFGTASATGTATTSNPILVKYNASLSAQWINTIAAGTTNATFNAIGIDSGNNIYGAGFQSGNGTYTYGSQSIAGPYNGSNITLVKYQ
ncbi:MAG: hypothetical protein U1F27_00390 [Turneriella sp.]